MWMKIQKMIGSARKVPEMKLRLAGQSESAMLPRRMLGSEVMTLETSDQDAVFAVWRQLGHLLGRTLISD
jgi:hypothetical protein